MNKIGIVRTDLFCTILEWFICYIFHKFLGSDICLHSFNQNILWKFWRYTWYNWNLTSGAQNMKQTIANFFSKLALPKSLKRHPQSASRDTNGAMKEIRDSSGSETDHHLAIYSEMHSPSTKLWWDKIKMYFENYHSSIS